MEPEFSMACFYSKRGLSCFSQNSAKFQSVWPWRTLVVRTFISSLLASCVRLVAILFSFFKQTVSSSDQTCVYDGPDLSFRMEKLPPNTDIAFKIRSYTAADRSQFSEQTVAQTEEAGEKIFSHFIVFHVLFLRIFQVAYWDRKLLTFGN